MKLLGQQVRPSVFMHGDQAVDMATALLLAVRPCKVIGRGPPTIFRDDPLQST